MLGSYLIGVLIHCVKSGRTITAYRLGGKLLRQFTELRQQCCHPQIVRRDMWLGKSRLSMRQILTRLILKAFNEYDIAVRAELTARTLQAAVSCDPADAGAFLPPQPPQHLLLRQQLMPRQLLARISTPMTCVMHFT